jgi:hypothetical protein
VDLKKYRDMHKENVGKFREMRAQKLLNGVVRGQSAGSSSRKAMNAAYSGYENNASSSKKTAAAAAKANNSRAATAADPQNKVWLKLVPTPEVPLTLATISVDTDMLRVRISKINSYYIILLPFFSNYCSGCRRSPS